MAVLIHSAISPLGAFYVVMEHIPNDNLRKFLRKSRKVRDNMGKGTSSVSNLSPSQLLNFAIGVAKAMVHISSAEVRTMEPCLFLLRQQSLQSSSKRYL